MRDYSFGNFLHELRERRGLSQYQLGVLAGVSDKAVSKWENGSAKPRSSILSGLSEALGVTVDELLACRYRSMENRNEKGVSAMKKKLWNKVYETMQYRYGKILPVELSNRYFSEYGEMKNTDEIIYYELLGQMSKLAEKTNRGHIRVNGGIGASYAAYILGATEVNPLKPHYYCPNCRKIQFREEVLCGWDLPEKKCSCGRELLRDGHNLPFETLRWSLHQAAHYDVYLSQNLYQAVKQLIFTYFKENKVIILTKKDNSNIKTLCPSITLIKSEELDKYQRLEELTNISFAQVPFTDRRVLEAFQYRESREHDIQREGGWKNSLLDGIPEFKSEYTQNMIREAIPESFHDLIQVSGLNHGTGVWEGNGRQLVRSGISMGRVIAYRDDVFNYIQKEMDHRNISGTGYAFHIMEDVRRGIYARDGMPEEVRQQLSGLGAEEWFIESLGKIWYLFPRAHGVLWVRYALILMWYKMHYPEAFRKCGF